MCRNDVPIDSLTVPSRPSRYVDARGFLSKFPIVGIFDGENYLFFLSSSVQGRGDYSSIIVSRIVSNGSAFVSF